MKAVFEDIFYPSDKTELLKLVKAEEAEGTTPRLMLLPHASLKVVGDMYKEAFSLVHNPKRIVVFAPLHNEVMQSDEGEVLFTLSSTSFDTCLGSVEIESAPGVKVNDSYAEEEYSVELVALYTAANAPFSRLMPVFTRLESKADVMQTAQLMTKLRKDEPNTLFILSGNFTREGKSEEINKEARMLYELLENNAPLLDAGNKKKISGCAYMILEASRVFQGIFQLKSTKCGTYTGNEINNMADGKIWQVFGVKAN